MLAKILLTSKNTKIEFMGFGDSPPIFFNVIAPSSETAFFEELLLEKFSSLKIDPEALFSFLSSDEFVQSKFDGPLWIQKFNANRSVNTNTSFAQQNLGKKLLISGIVNTQELDLLLDEYQPFAQTQRFGEFLKLKLDIPFQVLNFFLDSSSLSDDEFNGMKLGARLVKMGLVSEQVLIEALDFQKHNSSLRLGDILVAKKAINPNLADFFSRIRVGQSGQLVL